MAEGNTFGATALSSYGGFWLSFAIILTPGGFQIQEALMATSKTAFYDEFGLYLMVSPTTQKVSRQVTHKLTSPQGWFIFTFILVLCTLRSTVAFFLLFFTLDMAFLLLGIAYLHRTPMGTPNTSIEKAGGFFALLAAFLAWYNALAGIADDSNRYIYLLDIINITISWVSMLTAPSFFVIPVAHFPWSVTGMKQRGKLDATDKANV